MSDIVDPLYDEKKASFEDKLERKKESAIKAAENARVEAERLDKVNRHIGEIMNGQPILIGHHSEHRHRRELDKMWKREGKKFELLDKAKELDHKADLCDNPAGISSDDPDAIVKLEQKLIALQNAHQEIKDKPHKAWELSNSSQNMRSVKKRIEYLKSLSKVPELNESINGVDLVVDKIENRVKLLFPGKPSPEIISKLKSNGFHWSPYNKAWQRQISEWAIHLAKEIIKEVKP